MLPALLALALWLLMLDVHLPKGHIMLPRDIMPDPTR